jgi:hypothetical protein
MLIGIKHAMAGFIPVGNLDDCRRISVGCYHCVVVEEVIAIFRLAENCVPGACAIRGVHIDAVQHSDGVANMAALIERLYVFLLVVFLLLPVIAWWMGWD